MMTRRHMTLAFAAAFSGWAAADKETAGQIRFVRVPSGGIQPQATVHDRGTLHLVYYAGDAYHGDLFYVQSFNFVRSFSPSVRVNSGDGSAVAAGTIRG